MAAEWTFFHKGSWVPYGPHETVQIEIAFGVRCCAQSLLTPRALFAPLHPCAACHSSRDKGNKILQRSH